MVVLAAVIYWSSSISPMSLFSFKFSCQHVATFLLSFNGLFIVHFHSVEDFFVMFSHYFLIFKSHLHYYFFLLNIKVLLVIFHLIIFKGNIDRFIHMLLIYNLFHHFHENECISIYQVSWLCFNYGFWFFPLILVSSWPSWDT